jgi:hypothetical protein
MASYRAEFSEKRVKHMVMELVQMTLALGLFTIGSLLFGFTKIARQRQLARSTQPVWVRWVGSVLALIRLS